MLEWYRAGEGYETLMRDAAALMALAAETAGARTFTWRGREADPFAEPERLTLAEAFDRHAGIDLLACISGRRHRPGPPRGGRHGGGLRVAADDTFADLFSRVLVARVEPHLGLGRPTILCEYRSARRPSRGRRRTIPASPSGSSSMPAASNSPTPSGN